jgi:transposase
MRRYSEATKADVRRRMSPPNPQSMARISEETGIHVATLYLWRKGWRLEGEVVPASHKDPEGWGSADKFTVVLETAAFNATELSAYCRERGLYPEQVSHWRQVAPTWPWPAFRRHLMPTQSRYALWRSRRISKNSTLRIKERSRHSSRRLLRRNRRSYSARRRPWRRRRHCWCCEKSGRPSARRTRKADECRPAADGDRADRRGECRWRQIGSRLL